MSVCSRSNWNLEVLVFEERGKPEYLEKNLSEQGREPTRNSTHIWRRRRDLNSGHFGGRRVLSPLRQPCSLGLKPDQFNCRSNVPLKFRLLLEFGNSTYYQYIKPFKPQCPHINSSALPAFSSRINSTSSLNPEGGGGGSTS